MKKIYVLLLVLSMNLFYNVLKAQQGWTIYDNTNSPLLSGTYSTIAIDQNGNIWTGGSYTGLFKYDGSNWSNYSTFNSNILYDEINKILVDNSNHIWAANYKGVSVFNGSSFTNYDTLNAAFKGYTVYALGKDNNGVIWLSSKNGSFGYQGITTFNGSTWTNLTGYPSQIDGREFTDFAFTSSNDAWIACENGFVKYTSSSFSFYPEVVTGLWSSTAVAIDANSNIWTGGFDGLLKYDGSSWTMKDNVADMGLPSNTYYYDILPVGNILWIATTAGLLKYDRNNGTVLANYKSTNSPLADNCVTQIAKDASGKLWLSTTIGIVKMDPSQVGISEYDDMPGFSIYPNPSKGIIHMVNQGQKEFSFKIYSVDGTLIKSVKENKQNYTLDMTEYPEGVYYIQIMANGKLLTRKLVLSGN